VNPVTHLLAGWILTQAESAHGTARKRAIITLVGVAPDLDGLGIIPELLTSNSSHPLVWFSEYHYILRHNIAADAASTSVAYFFSGRSLKNTFLACASFHLHLLCDVMGARGPGGYQWPVPYLLPFTNAGDIAWSE